MKTILEVLQLSSEYLKKKGIDNARRQAEELLCDVLNTNRMQLYLSFDRPVDDKELEKCRSFLSRRAQGEPLAYIRGKVHFYNCEIATSSDVLIPRQETEILVDRVVQELKKRSFQDKVLWDLCCGSGCIGIALKKALPELKVILSDISSKALRVAEDNARRNQVEVDILEGDLFDPFKGKSAHFLICNPPYISQEEFKVLDREVRDYEPSLALLAENDGLAFYQKIADGLKPYLLPNGKAWFEIGYRQGSAVSQIFLNQGWTKCFVEKDWAGHDRFFSLENE